jgi:hypothetical protein
MNDKNCGGAIKAPKYALPPSYRSETLRSIHLSRDISDHLHTTEVAKEGCMGSTPRIAIQVIDNQKQ